MPHAGKPTRKRTKAREIAVQALYQMNVLQKIGAAVNEEVDGFIDREADEAEVREFAHELVAGVQQSQADIDALLSAVVENWKMERIAAMDLAILRMAAFELNSRADVPPKVSINEAIELAKKYSTAQSGAFVNGILDKLLELKRGKENDPGRG